MEKRFSSLRIIATVFKILAWVVLIGGILGAILMIIGGGLAGGGASRLGDVRPDVGGMGVLGGLIGGLFGGIGLLIVSVLQFLMLYAAGDAIYLALAIEENTRETAWYLKGGDTVRR